MRILGVSGSPRKGGNTDTAVRRVLELLADLGETEFLRIADHRIEHCRGCRDCMRLMRCSIEGDGFWEVFDKWLRADLLIVGSPVYWLSPPGVMKDFIDRSHTAFAHQEPPFKGKRAAIISVAAEGGFGTHERIIETWLRHYGADVLGKLRIYARERDELLNRPSQMRRVERFAAEIKGKLSGGGV